MWLTKTKNEPVQLTMEQLWGEGEMDMIDMSNMDDLDRVLFINVLAEQIHEIAKSKGFYDEPVSFPQAIALMHSELSEALEAHREGEPAERVAEELADTIIRILDTACYANLNVGRALVMKMEKNKAREHKHGKRY